MTTYPAWTPAPRAGIIPLHPLSFGTILGRSFAALRQNPRVLLGFALCVQAVAYLVLIVAVGGVAWAAFSRLDTLTPASPDYDAVMAGSIALTAITGFVLGLAVGALTVIIQGVVVAEVAHAAVAEKLTLGALWSRIRPIAWRLLGYAFLLALVVFALIALAVVVLFAIGVAALPAAVGLTVLVFLGAIPLTLWLTVKLLLAPAAIILEGATIRGAIARSWVLTRGRFWPALGIVVVVSVIFSAIAQVIGIPFQLLTTGLSTVIAPTGDPTSTGVITLVVSLLVVEALTLLVQSVSLVVQSTSTALIYLDCRMRREGLDLDLLAYVEQRDAGVPGLPDPYRAHIGRVVAPRLAPPPAYAGAPVAGYAPYPPGYAAPPAYPAAYPPPAPSYPAPPAYSGPPAYPPASAYPPPAVYPAPPAYSPPPAYSAPPAYSPPPAPPAAPTSAVRSEDRPEATPSATNWTAPEAPADRSERESR